MIKNIKRIVLSLALTGSVLMTPVVANAEEVTTVESNVNVINPSIVAKVFDANYYATTYPDVAAIVGNDAVALLNHYVKYGIAENRDASKDFNVSVYAMANTDLREAFGDNLNMYFVHYVTAGINENRVSSSSDSPALMNTITKASSNLAMNNSNTNFFETIVSCTESQGTSSAELEAMAKDMGIDVRCFTDPYFGVNANTTGSIDYNSSGVQSYVSSSGGGSSSGYDSTQSSSYQEVYEASSIYE